MMTEAKAPNVYDPIAKTLHWGIAFAILMMFVTAILMDAPKNIITQDIKHTILTAHKSTGLLVLVLMLFRLFWFMRHARPKLPENLMPYWQVIAAHYVHAGLYIVAILTPLVGWAMISMGPYPLVLFGLIEIPPLPLAALAQEHTFLRTLTSDMHETLATFLAGLIVIHTGATMLHHFVDRDDIFLRIAPECLHGWLRKIRGG